MLSIGSLSSASGAAEYFIKGGEGQIAGYYSDHVAASKWGGGAKEILGLSDGPVDLEVFEALLDGKVSDTQTLGRMKTACGCGTLDVILLSLRLNQFRQLPPEL